MKKKYICIAAALLACIMLFTGCGGKTEQPAAEETTESAITASLDYSSEDSWAYFGEEKDKAVDVFFIAPCSIHSDGDAMNADMTNEDNKTSLHAAIGMESGLYNGTGNFYAPYYSQMVLEGYDLSQEEQKECLDIAYADVKAAFDYYMANENNGKPFIIAAFSQGSDMGLRLLKEYGMDSGFSDKMVAAYFIGWKVTEEELTDHPFLKMAQGADDTGVIITFDCESADVNDTIIVPEGTFTYSINPLNWKTDSTPASKEENLGYVYPASDGSVKKEIPNLCGAVIDPERGTIKVSDISPEDFPAHLSFLPEGSYHIYDYELFYRNLQQNVQLRTDSYLSTQ